MPSNRPAHPPSLRLRIGLVAALAVGVTVTGVSIAGVSAEQPSVAAPGSTTESLPPKPSAIADRNPPPTLPPLEGGSTAVSAADGGVPDGTTVFDSSVAAVAKLDPGLLSALQRAALDAGITFLVNSGWRSPEYQAELLREAVVEYGSAAEAARWVATPATSPHVRGDAVDLGTDAATWLSARGARFGLCQVYANEPWHYELRPGAAQHGCPAMYPDPTYDPRMHS